MFVVKAIQTLLLAVYANNKRVFRECYKGILRRREANEIMILDKTLMCRTLNRIDSTPLWMLLLSHHNLSVFPWFVVKMSDRFWTSLSMGTNPLQGGTEVPAKELQIREELAVQIHSPNSVELYMKEYNRFARGNCI